MDADVPLTLFGHVYVFSRVCRNRETELCFMKLTAFSRNRPKIMHELNLDNRLNELLQHTKECCTVMDGIMSCTCTKQY